MTAILYERPSHWMVYDGQQLTAVLSEAKASVISLRTVPYQRRWVEALQQIELKREVAGTSRIEGAEFTDRELEAAMNETPEQLFTRSQKQAHAAVQTYRWIATVPIDRPIDGDMIREIHRRMITGADDDHCPPGILRQRDHNVHFGAPRHRGVDGGDLCEEVFRKFTNALQQEYRNHDPILQAIAAHYHFAAMHPFMDGNGRTARALEALMLQRAGLRDTSFLAMSNYYYDEKGEYLSTLASVRQANHDLTAFMRFVLKGVTQQSQRLLTEIQREISKELYRSLAIDLFNRLKTPKKRVIAERQLEILKILLTVEKLDFEHLVGQTAAAYGTLKKARNALVRDVNNLSGLEAISVEKTPDARYLISVRLDWPTKMTQSAFFKKIQELPKAKTGAISLQ